MCIAAEDHAGAIGLSAMLVHSAPPRHMGELRREGCPSAGR